jgi:hypothetical protein
MEEITDYNALRPRIRASGVNAVVGIEGFCGSGKSYLADRLGRDLIESVVVHTDDYATGDDETVPYVDRIDYRRLRHAVSSASGMVIVDGICLRPIMRRLGLTPALFVYVKCISVTGLWHDGLHLEDFADDPRNQHHEPHRSDFRYHSDERPHERADIAYCHREPAWVPAGDG